MKKFKEFTINEASRVYDKTVSPVHVSSRLPKRKGEDKKNINPHTLTGPNSVSVQQSVMSDDPEEHKTLGSLVTKLRAPTRSIPKTVKGVKSREDIPTYPNMNPEMLAIKDPHTLVARVGDQVERNVEWSLDRAETIHELAARSQQWYVGAHKIAGHLAKRFNVPHHVAAAVLATQSPQKDWYQNVSLAERILKIHHSQQNTAWSPEMEKISSKVFSKDSSNHQSLLSAIRGKTLGELTTTKHKAAWIRAYDEGHHARHHRYITPEGDFGEHVTNQGKNKKRTATGWGGFGSIGKAITAIESGGDVEKISGTLGNQHKVRSFYNNIAQPNSPIGDVTIDTHATGNALGRYSLSGKSPEVHDVLGGSPRSSRTGMAGTYPLMATAFRNVAARRNLIPNAVQSVVWDERRATAATIPQKRAIDMNWEKFRAGAMSHEEVLASMSHILGKAKKPSWADAKTDPNIVSTFESVKHRQTFKDFL